VNTEELEDQGAPTPVQPDDGLASRSAYDPDELIDLYKGEGLSESQTSLVTKRAPTRVVLLAGPAQCGKTSLVVSAYLQLQRGAFAGHAFAGSTTLMGFEQRAHDARAASQRTTPALERTKFSEYLHLRLYEIATSRHRDVLFCDFTGEDFRRAKDSVEDCREMEVLRRADGFALMIDGERISSLESRQSTKADALFLLRNLLDSEMLSSRSSVDVLFTKWDLVESLGGESAKSFAQRIEDEFRQKFSSRVAALTFTRVAACPAGKNYSFGHGVAEPLSRWMRTGPERSRRVAAGSKQPAIQNQYDLFGRRWSRGD